MGRNRVLCEVHPETKRVIRVLKYAGSAIFLKPEQVAEWPKIEAERDIKKQLLKIQRNECPYCGAILNMSSHLHERVWRSKGGEPSLTNSVVICAECHIGPKGEHSNRAPQWGKSSA